MFHRMKMEEILGAYLTLITIGVTSATSSNYNYDHVLHLSLLFYEAQKSGHLPPDNRIPWRGDSALDDKAITGEDLTGGFYDGNRRTFNFLRILTNILNIFFKI